MRYLTVIIVNLTLLFTPLFSQERFSLREQGWEEELEQLAQEIAQQKGGRTAPVVVEKVNHFLADKPIQILAEERVWKIVGASLTDPYSRPIEYLFNYIYKYPGSEQSNITTHLERIISRAVRELTSLGGLPNPSDEQLSSTYYQQRVTHLRSLLQLYVLPKSALYLSQLDIHQALLQGQYEVACQLVEEGERLALFRKEERYLADLFRYIVENAKDNLSLIAWIDSKVLAQLKEAESVGVLPLNNYDILAATSKLLGNEELVEIYKERGKELQQRVEDSYGTLIKAFQQIDVSRSSSTGSEEPKSLFIHDILAERLALEKETLQQESKKEKGWSATKKAVADPANRYVVIASKLVKESAGWSLVATTLAKRYAAELLYFDNHPKELLTQLQRIKPRYLAIVEQPQQLEVRYVVELNRFVRTIEEGPSADCLWGIITGYNADYAMQMVENSAKPFVIKSALNTTGESSSGNIYQNFAWLDDGGKYFRGYKRNVNDPVIKEKIDQYDFLKLFVKEYIEIEPDLIISSSHATEETLEMPFSKGNLRSLDGQLYADFGIPCFLPQHRNPRVYFAAGNCLIGNMERSPQAMAAAWLSGGGATSMIGYTVPTWYGRAGWGALKYWIANPGNLTLAQANYLNQQEMLYILDQWDPEFNQMNPDITSDLSTSGFKVAAERELGYKLDKEKLGFFHDRDVLCFYGDPAWDVRVKDYLNPPAYTTTFSNKSRRGGAAEFQVVVKTDKSYKPEKVKGAGIKEIHVEDLPFAYFLPQRVENISGVTLVERGVGKGANREIPLADRRVVINRDFILIYNPPFEAGKEYIITLKTEKRLSN